MNLIIVLVLLIYIVLFKINEKIIQKKHIQSIELFPYLKKIHKKLNDNLKQIQEECFKVINKINNQNLNDTFKRKNGHWSDDVAKNYINKLNEKNKWIYGWTQKNDWVNYTILYDKQIMNDIKDKLPTIYKIIEPYKNKFNVVGLSLLKPHGEIPYHYDVDTNLENNRMVYHFNIYCPNDYNNKGKSILKVYKNYNTPTSIEQKTGNCILFDASYYHSVVNDNPDYRLILYTDFIVSEHYRLLNF